MDQIKVYINFEESLNLSDSEFKLKAEDEGFVYTLENFQMAFNCGEISDEWYIRFLNESLI